LVEDISGDLVETKIEIGGSLNSLYKIQRLHGNCRRALEEFLDFNTNLRKNIGKYKYHNSYKDDIKKCDHMIGGRISLSNSMRSIFFSCTSPGVELICKEFTKLEKNICKKKSDEKKCEKILEKPSENEKC
jgi:hypothetical protein